jgi:MFS family permease
MVSSTTMIGDYFHGESRERWLAGQAGTATLGAVVFFGIGGALGDGDWRNAFMLYFMGLIAAVAAIALLFEPQKTLKESLATDLKFPWSKMRGLYLLAFLGAILFFVPQVQVPFLLNDRGITSSQTIGLMTAAGALAVPLGSIVFKLRSKAAFWANLAIAFSMITVGLLLMAYGAGIALFLCGVVIASLGAGMYLPQLITGIMAHLHFDLRGRGTSGWQFSFFLGNFLSPLLMLGLTGAMQSISTAVAVMAVVSAIIVVALLVVRPANQVDADH